LKDQTRDIATELLEKCQDAMSRLMMSPASHHAAKAEETAMNYINSIGTSGDTKINGSFANGHAGHRDSSQD
jgi:hypothetical protein